jgi:hypothetical protein
MIIVQLSHGFALISSCTDRREAILEKNTFKFKIQLFLLMKNLAKQFVLIAQQFVAVWVTWVSFASNARGLRGGASIMLETHIMMSFLIFRLTLSLALCLKLLLVLCLSSLMDLTIAHIVLVHERTALSVDALVVAHVLIVVIVSCVGIFFLLEGLTLTLSQDTWTVHIFPTMVHVPLGQVMLHKGL